MSLWHAGVFLVLTACSASNVERRHLADGSWEVTCRLPMDECVRQADILCMGQRYRIAHGESQHIVRGAGPSQIEYRTSELAFVCSSNDSATASSSAPSPPGVHGAEGTPHNCVPGATQACVGPGGCAGGQACTPDGAAFGPCDCGPPRALPSPTPLDVRPAAPPRIDAGGP